MVSPVSGMCHTVTCHNFHCACHICVLSCFWSVDRVSKFETPELKRDLEKGAKTAEDEAEVSLSLSLQCHLTFLWQSCASTAGAGANQTCSNEKKGLNNFHNPS